MTVTSKQRAYLRSLAANIDTIRMVGKAGIGDDLMKQAADALTKREIIKGKVLVYAANMNLYKDKYDVLLDHGESYGEKLPLFIVKGEEFYLLRITPKLAQELFKDYDNIAEPRLFYGYEIMINKTMDKWVVVDEYKKKYFNFLREEKYESNNKN